MKTRLLFLLLILAAIVPAHADYDAEVRQQKADYFFLEALRRRALGDESLSFALMQRALDLTSDPTGREAFEVGGRMMVFARATRDSLQLARGLELCRNYFDANTTDTYAGSFLANYYAESGNAPRAIEIYETLERTKPDNTALLAAHADLLMRERRIDDATLIYRRLERTLGRNTALTQRLVSGLVMQGDTAGAIAEINDLIAAQPRSIEALHLGAYMTTMLNRPELGLGYVERAKALDPTNGATYYHAANIYKALGRTSDYEAAIRGAIEGEELDADSKIELLRFFIGEELSPGGEGSEKIDPLFESLVGQYTHNSELRRLYASYLITLSRYAPAAEEMEQVVALTPGNPADLELLARLYGSANDLDRMVATTRRAISQYPNLTGFHELQAGVLANKGDYPGALQTLREALRVDSLTVETRSDLCRDIADIAQQQPGADADTIRTYYERSLELNPENDMAMNNYAYWLSENAGDLLRAKELIARAVVFDPGSATFYDTYAWVCFRLGELEDAKRYIDMAILFDKSEQEGSPEQMAEILGHAAEIYERLGQADKAAEYRQRVELLTKQQ